MPRPLQYYLGALTLVGCIATLLAFTAAREYAIVASTIGTIVSTVVMLGYILFLHSRSRWPHATVSERAAKLFTYTR